MSTNTKKKLLPVRNRSYLNRDFDGFRAQLLEYAKTFFPDKITDFSEASVGGMLLDFASFVGDNLSFYLDHQFSELNPATAVETDNIIRLLKGAGIKTKGASPAVVYVTFKIEVPAIQSGSRYIPDASLLPQILKKTVVTSQSGINFELTDDLNFSSTDNAGNLKAAIEVATTTSSKVPATFFLSLAGLCISGNRTQQKVTIPNNLVPFRTINLSRPNVTEIISIIDSDLNEYYEVDSLSQDTIFTAMTNRGIDNDLVKENMEMRPAPYRYVTRTNFRNKQTTIIFGSGDADSLDDDIVPDPSEFAVPLYGKSNFSRFSIDPNNLLKTKTLGISPKATTLTISYRSGGGLAHNVAANTIKTVTTLFIKFNASPSTNGARFVQSSLQLNNNHEASGGENAPTINELKTLIPAARNAQSRIVTSQDLLARVYTMPSNFGRVYRASVRSNPNNPLATQLFIISRNAKGQLIVSPDALKINLTNYLLEFRMISDAIDILDARVINLQVRYSVTADDKADKSSLNQQIISQLKSYFKVKNFQIDQVIPLNDLQNLIFNTPGVLSIKDLRVYSLTGTYKGREYSTVDFSVAENTLRDIILPPIGGLFEMRYPDYDIIGSVE